MGGSGRREGSSCGNGRKAIPRPPTGRLVAGKANRLVDNEGFTSARKARGTRPRAMEEDVGGDGDERGLEEDERVDGDNSMSDVARRGLTPSLSYRFHRTCAVLTLAHATDRLVHQYMPRELSPLHA